MGKKERKKERANVIDAAGQPPFTSKVSLVFCHLKKMSSTWTKWQNLHAFCLCQDASSISLSLSLSLSQDHNNHCLVSVTKRLELWTSHQKKRNKPDLNRSLKIFVRTLSHVWQFVMLNGSRIWGNLDLFWTDRVGAAITVCKQNTYIHAHSPQTTPFPHATKFLGRQPVNPFDAFFFSYACI